jgi:hypothetical protein
MNEARVLSGDLTEVQRVETVQHIIMENGNKNKNNQDPSNKVEAHSSICSA